MIGRACTATLVLAVLAVLAGCDRARPTTSTRPSEPPSMPDPVPATTVPAVPPCRAVVVAQPGDTYAIRFELTNPGDAAVVLDTHEPVLGFDARAEAGGAAVAIHQPMLDLPVRRVRLEVPARGALTVRTPIRLVIADGARPVDDRFTWTIAHAPEGLTLDFTLQLPEPFAGPCRASPAATEPAAP